MKSCILAMLILFGCATATAKPRMATCEDNGKVLAIIAAETWRIQEDFKKKDEHLNTVLAFELAGLEVLYKRVKEFHEANCTEKPKAPPSDHKLL